MSIRERATRDRHGRGSRCALFAPTLPIWRTRREQFDESVSAIVAELLHRWPASESIDFGVEEVPPSGPAPWEDDSVLVSRVFPADHYRGLRARIIIYRRAVELRTNSDEEKQELIRAVLVERLTHILIISPSDIDDYLE